MSVIAIVCACVSHIFCTELEHYTLIQFHETLLIRMYSCMLHTNGFFSITFYAFHVFSKRIIFLVGDFRSNCSHGICVRNQRCTIGAP